MLFRNIYIAVKPKKLNLYFAFFKEIFTNQISKIRQTEYENYIQTTDGRTIYFITKDTMLCGCRADIYFNLTNDEKFEQEILKPMFQVGYRTY